LPWVGSPCRARHWARDPQIEITLSLITPYVAYWLPAHFGGSGVIATVACGLYMSWNGPLLISAATRLQGIFFWNLVIYLIEGLLFLLTGFQMRLLYERSKTFPIDDILIATALVTLMIVIARFAWTFPAIYVPRMIERVRLRDPAPPMAVGLRAFVYRRPWRGFAGRRPGATYALPDGSVFPHRELILFVAFGVIFITLVGFGLGLAPVVRWLGVAQAGRDERVAELGSEISARREALDAALKSLESMTENRDLSEDVIRLLRARHETRTNQLPDSLDPAARLRSAAGTDLTRELIAAERQFIHDLLRDGKITDETRRHIERDLDLKRPASPTGNFVPNCLEPAPALPATEMGRLLDAVESFQRQNCIGELIGAFVQDRTGQRQEFLRHRFRIWKRRRLT